MNTVDNGLHVHTGETPQVFHSHDGNVSPDICSTTEYKNRYGENSDKLEDNFSTTRNPTIPTNISSSPVARTLLDITNDDAQVSHQTTLISDKKDKNFINNNAKPKLPNDCTLIDPQLNSGSAIYNSSNQKHNAVHEQINHGDLFDTDNVYFSDTSDLDLFIFEGTSQPNDSNFEDSKTEYHTVLNNNLENNEDIGATNSLPCDSNMEIKKLKGNNPANTDVTDHGHLLAKSQGERKVKTHFKRGSSKLLRANSRPGMFSDDEYVIKPTTWMANSGRRSAPVFTKRGFSTTEYWTSGQTSIEKAYQQHITDALARQRSKSLATNTFKVARKRNALSENTQRSYSVDPDNYRNKTKYDQNKRGYVQTGMSGLKGFFPSYGSTENTIARTERRNYYSEGEAGCPQSPESVCSSPKIRSYQRNFQNEATLESQMWDASDIGRTRGMMGVFRTPRATSSSRDPQVMVTHGSDCLKSSNNPRDYILEQVTAGFNKQSPTPPSNKSSGDDSSSEDDDSDDEDSPIVKDVEKSDVRRDVKTHVYKRRWYLLLIFSLSAMLWNAIWSTWGPIAQSAKDVYGWSDGDIAMFTYLGNIPFLITMFPCAYLMDVRGMKMAMIFCCSFMFVGAGFRCIPGDKITSTWLIRTGQLLNGIAGTIPSSGPALISGLWFPPNQRATATAISTVAGYLGASISFVIGPLLVPEPNEKMSPINNTFYLLNDIPDTGNSSSNDTDDTYSDQEKGIKNILYFECGLAGLLLLLVLIYFPSRPPLPPSISASVPREKYLNGLKLLVRNKQFWVCAIAFSVPLGVYESWQVILDVNLDSRGISQQTAGWMDFYATVGGCISGLLVSRFADIFTRQMKLFLMVFYFFATVAILWFTLIVFDIIPFDQVSIYAAIVIAGVFLDGGSPLFFELTIEVSYPIGEGVTSGFTHMLCAAAGTIFLLIVQIESIGTDWMNWCFLGCVALALPLLFLINTNYARAELDDIEIEISEDDDSIKSIESPDINEKTSLLESSNV